MNKIVKLSLVTAVALAGLSSVNAASLEEAIKGVDVSGNVRYRYNDKKVKDGDSTQNNDYDIELTAKIPVNDSVKATIKFDFSYDYTADTADASRKSLDIEDAFFTYTHPSFVGSMGKQNVPGPQSDGINGTGIVLTAPLGSVSLVGTYFNSTGVSARDLYQAAILASFGPVNADLWYGDVADTLSAYTLGLGANIDVVSISARYSKKNLDDVKDEKLSVAKLNVSANLGMATVSAGFARTGKHNGGIGAALDTSGDSAVNTFNLKQHYASMKSDAKSFKVGVSFKANDSVTLGLGHINTKYKPAKDKIKAKETAVSASYAMSSNFKISSYYSMMKDNSVKTNKGRLELKYSF